MLKLPVNQVTVSLNEVPDKVSCVVELGGCLRACKGCHSPNLQGTFTKPKMYLSDLEEFVDNQIEKGCDAICIMGGDCSCEMTLDELKAVVNTLATIAPVCLYSSNPNAEPFEEMQLKWLKVGPYIESKGGLETPGTNQMLLEITRSNRVDIIDTFHHEVTEELAYKDITNKLQKRGY